MTAGLIPGHTGHGPRPCSQSLSSSSPHWILSPLSKLAQGSFKGMFMAGEALGDILIRNESQCALVLSPESQVVSYYVATSGTQLVRDRSDWENVSCHLSKGRNDVPVLA